MLLHSAAFLFYGDGDHFTAPGQTEREDVRPTGRTGPSDELKLKHSVKKQKQTRGHNACEGHVTRFCFYGCLYLPHVVCYINNWTLNVHKWGWRQGSEVRQVSKENVNSNKLLVPTKMCRTSSAKTHNQVVLIFMTNSLGTQYWQGVFKMVCECVYRTET